MRENVFRCNVDRNSLIDERDIDHELLVGLRTLIRRRLVGFIEEEPPFDPWFQQVVRRMQEAARVTARAVPMRSTVAYVAIN